MYFGEDNTIKGANVQSYLLEKSRVVSIATGERTYHAFYALIASKKYNTKSVKDYKFLSKSNCFTATGVDDAQNFTDINNAMESIEFEKSEQTKIWLLLKAILEIGNIEFDGQPNKENHEKPCKIVKKDDLKSIS
jgi:myosin-5